MAKPAFNKIYKETIDSILLKLPRVKPGKMFGYPAYYINGKLFACLFEDGVCVKVPESFAKKLIMDKKGVPFERMGRTMREWVQLNRKDPHDFIKDKTVFKKSLDYVLTLTREK